LTQFSLSIRSAAASGVGGPASIRHRGSYTMKKDIHPEYRAVVFQDVSSDFSFLTRSTIKTRETVTWTDGKEYPLVKVEVSSHSHPFYTGKQKIVDTAGRVDRFRRKYGLS
jgi:large subunit ribosomal protein L31